MIIDHVFEILARRGIVRSQCEFSRNFLGKSARYYSYLLATKNEPPVDVLVGLSMRLQWLADAETDMQACRIFRKLSDELRDKAVRQSIVTLPRPRKASLAVV